MAARFEISDDGLAARLENNGGLPDVVYECVGKPGLMDLSVALAALRDVIVGVGLCVEPNTFGSFTALHKEVTIKMSAFFTMPQFETVLRQHERTTLPPTPTACHRHSDPRRRAAVVCRASHQN
ncbi:zinc-binding dehydrogenase [Sulfitobacter sp. THAF37]|uniref:zinc-binding dehydrogenase n=1 Tax=Sulfitobacter sp. THAF37 TaxID=2587855 RepID=UPI0034A12327